MVDVPDTVVVGGVRNCDANNRHDADGEPTLTMVMEALGVNRVAPDLNHRKRCRGLGTKPWQRSPAPLKAEKKADQYVNAAPPAEPSKTCKQNMKIAWVIY